MERKKYEKEIEYKVEENEAIEALNSGESADEEMKELIREKKDIIEQFNPKAGKVILDFLIELDKEIKKFFLFYQTKEKEIYTEIDSDIFNFKLKNLTIKTILIELQNFEALANKVLDVSRFININLTAIKKILKKFDKKFALKDNPFAKYYLKKNFKREKSYLVYILQFKIIDEASAMIEKYVKMMKNQFEVICSHPQEMRKDIEDILYEPLLDKAPYQNFLMHQKEEGFLDETNKYFDKINEILIKIDNDNILMASNVENWTLMIQSNIRTAEGDLVNRKLENEYFDKLVGVKKEDENFVSSKTRLNIWISLVHTFVYTMNGYIVQTTNGKYIDSLGSDQILSGIIMSFAHLSSVLTTLIYSHWTNNQTYKFSLIVSCICLILGNFFYSAADGFNSLMLMGLGRLLIGSGGARIVNRRYLIDQVPKASIGYYSLFYVNGNCLGMALGPLAGWGVAAIMPDFTILGTNFNLYTNPGWVMFVVWFIYLAIIISFYEDPDEKKEDSLNSTKDEEPLKPRVRRSSVVFPTPHHHNSDSKRASKLDVNFATDGSTDNIPNLNDPKENITPKPPKIVAKKSPKTPDLVRIMRKNSNDSASDDENIDKVKKNIENEIEKMVATENRLFSNLSSGFLILISILLVIRVNRY